MDRARLNTHACTHVRTHGQRSSDGGGGRRPPRSFSVTRSPCPSIATHAVFLTTGRRDALFFCIRGGSIVVGSPRGDPTIKIETDRRAAHPHTWPRESVSFSLAIYRHEEERKIKKQRKIETRANATRNCFGYTIGAKNYRNLKTEGFSRFILFFS
jgi:hypothetical protein